MVYPLLTSSTLLRIQRTALPQTIIRYKSLTSAIERGRERGPERSSRPGFRDEGRPRQNVREEGEKTRRELRLERFGSATYGVDAPKRPNTDRKERTSSPRSSRFGRVGPPRPRDTAPSRFGDERPRRDGIGPPRERRQDRFEQPPRVRDGLPREHRQDRFEQRRRDREGPPQERRQERFEQPPRGRDGPPRERRGNSFGSAPDRAMGGETRFGAERKPFTDHYSSSRSDGQETRRSYTKERDGVTLQRERSFSARDGTATSDRKVAFKSRESLFEDESNSRNSPNARDSRPYATPGTASVENRLDKSGSLFSTSPRRRDETDKASTESRFPRPDSKGGRRVREQHDRNSPPYLRSSPVTNKHILSDTAQPAHYAHHLESLPYTTAASEFVYGHSSVMAAIKANRRKFYNFYIHSRGASRDGLLARIREQKLFSITNEVGDDYIRAMDKASNGRPHNGIILEASALPVPPITELKAPSLEDESFSVALDSQSTEDALVNGKQELYSYKSAGWRHPLILYVDGVLDEGNLGAIARSAYLLGVDAIITPIRQTAPWSHIALKASAGAAEAIPLFKVGDPAEFLGRSSRAGWRIYASDSVPPANSISSSASDDPESAASKVVYTIARSTKRLPVDYSPVAEHPTILMMGAEATGLRESLLNVAHYKVGIPQGRETNEVGVDSLNVSVAASILCYEMLQRPQPQVIRDPEQMLF